MVAPSKAAPLRVIAYLRVSTQGQADNGVSLDTQEEVCRAYCTAVGYDLVSIVRETASAATLERPRLSRTLERIYAGKADGLICSRLDRVSRSVRDFCGIVERFHDADKALILVQDRVDTGTASGRLIAHVLASLSQFERERISERTKEALAIRKAQGVRLGPPLRRLEPWQVDKVFAILDAGWSMVEAAKAAQTTPFIVSRLRREREDKIKS